jgi:preprotein translocase subunit SecB
MDVEKIKSGYQLRKVVLRESQFKLKDPNNLPTELKFDIQIGDKIGEGFIETVIKLGVSDANGSDSLIIDVMMVGIFDIIGESALDIEFFRKINGPTIVYPFVRQLVRSISLDAGINPIMIPTVNFHKISKGEDLS